MLTLVPVPVHPPGMLIESMAGKSGALQGNCYDATPFSFDEKNTAYAHFGDQLRQAGYNYYGSERMYSGITGTELEVDIFIGVVYYQRLRHMVCVIGEQLVAYLDDDAIPPPPTWGTACVLGATGAELSLH